MSHFNNSFILIVVCRGTVWWPNLYCFKFWSKKPNTMNSCRVWIEELGLSKLNEILHGVREHTNKNKSHCTERSPRMIRLKLDLWIQVSAVGFLCMLQYFPLLFPPSLTRTSTHYIGLFLSSRLYTCRSS